MTIEPLSPFAAWPVQRRFRVGLIWVCPAPRAIVTQAASDEVREDDVHELHDALDALVSGGFVSADRHVLIVHDWRRVRGVTRAVRKIWLERARRSGEPFTRSASYVATELGSIFRIMANTVSLARQLASGQQTTLVDDLEQTVTELGLRPPPADAYERALRGELT